MDNHNHSDNPRILLIVYYAALVFFGAMLGVVEALLGREFPRSWDVILNAVYGSAIFCFVGFWFQMIVSYAAEGAFADDGKTKKIIIVVIMISAFLAGSFLTYMIKRKRGSEESPCVICGRYAEFQREDKKEICIEYQDGIICPNCIARGIADGSIGFCENCGQVRDMDEINDNGYCDYCDREWLE